jgi:UDP-2-acetamido-2,6-beta-L-arabino-hexul-4-ose reductase
LTLRILLTGADGFVGKNLLAHLKRKNGVDVVTFTRKNVLSDLPDLLGSTDIIFHLAGVNRPPVAAEFESGNSELTLQLCEAIAALNNPTPKTFVFASSIQAERDNAYGTSKKRAEDIVFDFGRRGVVIPFVFRFPNIFGKWCKPNYNSAIATFCYNIAHGLSISIHDPMSPLTLIYVDDVIAEFLKIVDGAAKPPEKKSFCNLPIVYKTTVGEVAAFIQNVFQERPRLRVNDVGAGLHRALYSTCISYLSAEQFAYDVVRHEDQRGVFVEMLKTPSSGQFSYFTARPGITRGGHFHHTKTEKFLVIKGKARFRFRHIDTGETRDIVTQGEMARIIDTAPGWAHDITNIGDDELIVALWANEVFDNDRPDTFMEALGTDE